MKTIGEFFYHIYDTKILEAKILMDEWRESVPADEWNECECLPLNREHILNVREQISALFAGRLMGICTEPLYDRIRKAHVAFIMELDEKARLQGFLITEKRACVTPTEVMRDAGLIQVTSDGVNLTPKGVKLAQQIQEEIDGEE